MSLPSPSGAPNIIGAGRPTPRTVCLLIIALFLFALFLRSWIVFHGNQPFYEGDGQRYDEMIERWRETGIYSYGSDEPNARVTPGFPLFYYAVFFLFGKSEATAVWTQMLISSLTVVPVFFLLYRTAGLWLASAAALGVAVYPPFIFGSGLFLTEPLFLLLLACFFWAWSRWMEQPVLRRLWPAAVLLSWAVLTRPAALPIVPIALLFLWAHRPARKQIWTFAAFMAVCFAPWVIRNLVTLGEFTLLASDSGNALLSGAYPYFAEPINWKEMYSLGLSQTQYGIKVIIHGFQTDFLKYLEWFTIGKLRYLFSHLWISETMGFPVWLKAAGILLHFALVLSWIVILPWKLWRRDFTAWCFAAMLAFQLLFIPTVRYASPFILMGLILAALALKDGTERFKHIIKGKKGSS
jgi:4-amino-4-deoxy-L-arabinose transferase-like glycosyltransferase